MRYWLMKSEPDCFSIQHLAAAPDQTTGWSGVRNFQARNFMRDQMQLGDRVLYYHSGADPAAIVGVAEVVREAYPDDTAWDPADDHFDPKASPANPIWQMVDIRLVTVFDQPLPLPELRGVPELKSMELLRKGSRLSVQPVTKQEFDTVLKLAKTAGKSAPSAKASAAAKSSAASKRKPKAAARAGTSAARKPASAKRR